LARTVPNPNRCLEWAFLLNELITKTTCGQSKPYLGKKSQDPPFPKFKKGPTILQMESALLIGNASLEMAFTLTIVTASVEMEFTLTIVTASATMDSTSEWR
jgi:hypothetical protein